MDENNLELLELYMDMVEKQDEIIYRMSHLLKDYAIELAHLRSASGFFEEIPEQEMDERILSECIDQYNEMKGSED